MSCRRRGFFNGPSRTPAPRPVMPRPASRADEPVGRSDRVGPGVVGQQTEAPGPTLWCVRCARLTVKPPPVSSSAMRRSPKKPEEYRTNSTDSRTRPRASKSRQAHPPRLPRPSPTRPARQPRSPAPRPRRWQRSPHSAPTPIRTPPSAPKRPVSTPPLTERSPQPGFLCLFDL
jgi:hypothetical protein